MTNTPNVNMVQQNNQSGVNVYPHQQMQNHYNHQSQGASQSQGINHIQQQCNNGYVPQTRSPSEDIENEINNIIHNSGIPQEISAKYLFSASVQYSPLRKELLNSFSCVSLEYTNILFDFFSDLETEMKNGRITSEDVIERAKLYLKIFTSCYEKSVKIEKLKGFCSKHKDKHKVYPSPHTLNSYYLEQIEINKGQLDKIFEEMSDVVENVKNAVGDVKNNLFEQTSLLKETQTIISEKENALEKQRLEIEKIKKHVIELEKERESAEKKGEDSTASEKEEEIKLYKKQILESQKKYEVLEKKTNDLKDTIEQQQANANANSESVKGLLEAIQKSQENFNNTISSLIQENQRLSNENETYRNNLTLIHKQNEVIDSAKGNAQSSELEMTNKSNSIFERLKSKRLNSLFEKKEAFTDKSSLDSPSNVSEEMTYTKEQKLENLLKLALVKKFPKEKLKALNDALDAKVDIDVINSLITQAEEAQAEDEQFIFALNVMTNRKISSTSMEKDYDLQKPTSEEFDDEEDENYNDELTLSM